MKAVELNNVSVYYGNLCALNNINISIEEEEFLGIIGPNGAGKSTLLKVILGLTVPDRGKINIFGKDIKEAAGLVSYVAQASKFDRSFPISVIEVVLMGSLIGRKSFFHRYRDEDRASAEHYLDKLGIYHLKDRQIGQLSGGQLQKVLLARALVHQPRIILLDEPTASIDANSRSQIYSLLKGLNEEVTIVVVTHDMAAVSAYFDSIACLNKEIYYHGGKEIDEETIEKVYGCPIELIAHGVPHRVLRFHEEGYDD